MSKDKSRSSGSKFFGVTRDRENRRTQFTEQFAGIYSEQGIDLMVRATGVLAWTTVITAGAFVAVLMLSLAFNFGVVTPLAAVIALFVSGFVVATRSARAAQEVSREVFRGTFAVDNRGMPALPKNRAEVERWVARQRSSSQ